MDPDQVIPFQSLSAVREMLRKEHGPTADFLQAWAAYRDGRRRVPGPIGIA